MHSNTASVPGGALRLWQPPTDDPDTRVALAHCLSSAFSSGVWREAPMPLGSKNDPDSALGIIQGLGPRNVAFAVTPVGGAEIVACVVGCIMDDQVIDGYRLADFGAEPGDGLLAFIGIVPEAQGLRFRPGDEGALDPTADGTSLARHLFKTWVDAAMVRDCPRLFVRTRRRLRSIRYLCESLGFELSGSMMTEFHGQSQTRLVYCRSNRDLIA